MNVKVLDVEIVADHQDRLGEGPLWHPVEKRLYWTDILNGRIHALDPATGAIEQIYSGDTVGGYTFQQGGGLLLFGERGSIRQYAFGACTDIIAEIEAEKPTRFNDVVADPEGRVFAGTIPIPGQQARLYRIDPNGWLTLVDDQVGLSNGLTFSLDFTKLYYSDSGGGVASPHLFVYDYDRATGEISNRRVLNEPATEDGNPDGLTIDEEGYLWSARWGGGCVIRFDPSGREDYRIELPARNITSCTFGGEHLGDLYITSAGGDNRGSALDGLKAGALFRLRPGVRGVPEHFSRVNI